MGVKLRTSSTNVLSRQAIDWVFPRFCIICGDSSSENTDICSECSKSIPIINSYCPICGVKSKQNIVCGTCQKQPPHFDQTYAGFDYTTPIDHFIKRLKYSKQLEFARILGEMFSHRLASTETPIPETVIPVPLHKERLRERGFNQSLEIARSVAKQLGIAIDYKSVGRVKPTPPQTELPFKKRRANVRNAFKIIKSIKGQHVAIIDDVMTTGSTADELARCLKQSGVRRVDVWTVARVGSGN